MQVSPSYLNRKTVAKAAIFINQSSSIILKVVFDCILIWPKVVCYHFPIMIKDIRHLHQSSVLMQPKFDQILNIFHKIYSKSGVLQNHLSRVDSIFCFLEKQIGSYDAIGISALLQKEKTEILKHLQIVVNHLNSAAFSIHENQNIISEVAEMTRLLNLLIDDLSSREHFFSKGRKRQESCSVPLRGNSITNSISIEIEPQSNILKTEYGRNKTSLCNHHIPQTLNEQDRDKGIATNIENENFLKQFDLDTTSFGASIVKFFYFIIVDVILGIPRFFLYELPHYIITIQASIRLLAKKTHEIAKYLVGLQSGLSGFDSFLCRLNDLESLFTGLELFIKEQDNNQDNVKFRKDLNMLMDSFHAFKESADSKSIVNIISGIQNIVFKLNPILAKVLESLHERSLAAAVTPNPYPLFSKKTKLSTTEESVNRESVGTLWNKVTSAVKDVVKPKK